MKKLITLFFTILLVNIVFSQQFEFYQNSKNQKHICGTFPLDVLEKDTVYSQWFTESYNDFKLSGKDTSWKKNLKNIRVEIFLGTWCGDSKNYVPKFISLWNQLKLDRNQLTFIALSSEDGHYKQSINREEKGKGIHRVPTFIFYKEGKEIARIVEKPINDLETDVAQIALGFPSKPSYAGANYLIKLLESNSPDDLMKNNQHIYQVYRLTNKSNELNTLGYVYLGAGETEKALVSFYYNTLFFKYEPNVYDSYAEALLKSGNKEKAIENYEKVLLLHRNNENAIKNLRELKSESSK